MLRRVAASTTLRRTATTTAAAAAPMALTANRSHYNWHIWYNPTRQPQLNDKQRAEIKVNEDAFPAEFKDYDEWDPYKNFPLWIEGMHTWSYVWLGAQLAFVWTFWDMVFPKSI